MATVPVHPSYNFDDADFAIRVEQPSIVQSAATVADFKVHREKLAAHSPVFADMFHVGESYASATGSVQDMVVVQARTPEVWPSLLASIYNSFDLFKEDFFEPVRLSLSGLLAIYEESHKYHLVTLHRLCATQLELRLVKGSLSLSEIVSIYQSCITVDNEGLRSACLGVLKTSSVPYVQRHRILPGITDAKDRYELLEYWSVRDREEARTSLQKLERNLSGTTLMEVTRIRQLL